MIQYLMLIDDDDDDKFFFREALKEVDAGIKFTTASNGIDALERLEVMDPLPGIIFLDNNMPRMSGMECLKELKSKDRYAAIPVVIYSTSSSPDFQAECEKIGAKAYLQKPNDLPGLVKILPDFLK